MSNGSSARGRNVTDRIRAVIECKSDRFLDILRVAQIDPKTGFRFQDCSDTSFAGQDLSGIDFTGANLCGCNFEDTIIDNACFFRARLGQLQLTAEGTFRSEAVRLTNFTPEPEEFEKGSATKWWRRNKVVGYDHLPIGAIFKDEMQTPELVIIPGLDNTSSLENITSPRIAISWFCVVLETVGPDDEGDVVRGERYSFTATEARTICKSMSRATGGKYRLPTKAELVHSRTILGGATKVTSKINHELNKLKFETDRDGWRRDILPFEPIASLRDKLIIHEWCEDAQHPVFISTRGSEVQLAEVPGEVESFFRVVKMVE